MPREIIETTTDGEKAQPTPEKPQRFSFNTLLLVTLLYIITWVLIYVPFLIGNNFKGISYWTGEAREAFAGIGGILSFIVIIVVIRVDKIVGKWI